MPFALPNQRAFVIYLPASLLAWAATAQAAAELRVVVTADGAPVEQAVIQLDAAGVSPAPPQDAVMDQVDSQFVPRVLLVPVGSAVRFPNSDSTRHQVYSFSPAKRFELPLYSGTPPDPVRFEQAGVVTLGCNIHDWMIGHIVVTDSAYAAVTGADGSAQWTLAEGEYRLRVWHERVQAGAPAVERVLQLGAGGLREDIVLQLSAPPPPRGSDRLRALQERLRQQSRDP